MIFNKPKFWDLSKPNFLSYLLLPFTSIIHLSNLIQNMKIPKKNKKIVSICIGNIYLGGTGKTPTTIKLYEIIKNIYGKSIVTEKKTNKNHYDEMNLLKSKTNFLTAPSRKEIVLKAIKKKNKSCNF